MKSDLNKKLNMRKKEQHEVNNQIENFNENFRSMKDRKKMYEALENERKRFLHTRYI